MSGFAFENALRLHQDSIIAYKSGSYPTSMHLSLLAKEELGKAFIFEELLYRVGITKEWTGDENIQKLYMMDALRSHGKKQRWFGRFVQDFMGRHSHSSKFRYASTLLSDIYSGKTQIKNENSVYVGLTRKKDGKIDLNGRISVPWKRISSKQAKEEITLLNDFLLIYAEGFSRNIYSTDSPDVGEYLTQDLVVELESLWTDKSKNAENIIRKLKKNPVTKNEWSWWDE